MSNCKQKESKHHFHFDHLTVPSKTWKAPCFLPRNFCWFIFLPLTERVGASDTKGHAWVFEKQKCQSQSQQKAQSRKQSELLCYVRHRTLTDFCIIKFPCNRCQNWDKGSVVFYWLRKNNVTMSVYMVEIIMISVVSLKPQIALKTVYLPPICPIML